MSLAVLRRLAFACLALPVLAAAQDPAACQSVRLPDIGWTDIAATNGLASVVLKGLGYKLAIAFASAPDTYAGLKDSKFDAFLGYWAPAATKLVEPYLKAGTVKLLPTPNLTGAKYTLAVPDYVAAGGLKSFADIARYREKLNFVLYGLEPGNDGNALLHEMIKKNQFNLGDFIVNEWGEKGMLMAVNKAVKEKRWIVFLAWEPHPMNVDLKLTYLSGGDKVFGPNFGEAKVYTVLSPTYADRCPNAARLFSNLRFTTMMENQVMKSIVDKQKPEAAATAWLKANPAVLTGWLAGVSTVDGKDGLAAVRASLGL